MFGRALGELDNIHVDTELLYAAALLHDVGLVAGGQHDGDHAAEPGVAHPRDRAVAAELEQIDEAMPPKLQLIRTQMALVLRMLPKVRAAANEAVTSLT